MTTQELYDNTVKLLPAGERLRLATLILNDLPPETVVDFKDYWEEEDLRDLGRATLARVNKTVEDRESA